MARCSACNQELEPGSTYCHICGTPLGTQGDGGSEAPKQDHVQLVEGVEKLRTRVQEVTSTPWRNLNESLGSPVSTQRQVLYALAGGFVLTSGLPGMTGLGVWLNSWLSCSFLLFWPIRYWTTGIYPFSAPVIKVFGSELSLRRRVFLALALTVLFGVLPLLGAFFIAHTVSRSLPPELAAELQGSAASGETGCFALFSLLGTYLFFFYMMGFVATWRAIEPSGFSLTLGRLASQAGKVTDGVLEAMQTQDIPGLQVTRVDLAKLEGSTWIPPGTNGEQLSLYWFSRNGTQGRWVLRTVEACRCQSQ